MRQVHRWLSAIFMLAVIFTTVALAMKTKAMWVNYVPLPPLFLLMITGTYMFFLPYFRKR
jgi:membrane protein CcdC involved in cytochrome C biogenesis